MTKDSYPQPKYRVVLLDTNRFELDDFYAETLKDAKSKARYLCSEEYAARCETTHADMNTQKAEIRDQFDACVWDVAVHHNNANRARLDIIVNEDDPGLDEDVTPRPTTTKVLTVAEYRLASMIAQLEPLTTQEEELTCAIESLRSAHRRICRIISDNEE